MNKLAPTIAAIVFDSGGVLLKHRHAFLEPAAVTEALREFSIGVGEQHAVQTVRAALDWLSSQAGSTTTEETAAAQRVEYYRRLLAGVGASASLELVTRLRDRLEGPESVEPFPEVREVLDALRARGLKLGVLSDGWASTIHLYERLGLADCFQSWTFSAVVGCCKPDPRIFAAAECDLCVEPAHILFVDDLPANVEGALRCGWQAVWLNRAGDQPAIHPSRTIRDLRELAFYCGVSLNV
ncbi:MAG: HAD family hydrolase [Verrucomicrobia bacterium]|nr:HAD family hydrolase [Verrucomicrobiota bacterium]